MKTKGLIVITGTAGCGKSTTQAALMNYMNEQVARNIITIEDPIEFVHKDRKCIFSQRQVGTDTKSFSNALKQSLRQDPNVILVGEMRDLETMATVLTAAETGHLIITTLHTPSAAQAVDRIIDVFPPHQQPQIRIQLSTTLQGVLHQILIPKSSGLGRVAAIEVMLGTEPVRHLIREGKSHQLESIIQTGSQYGMQSLERAFTTLFQEGLISQDDFMKYCVDNSNTTRTLTNQRINRKPLPDRKITKVKYRVTY